jgi:polyhydroxybutyrate depolymerase
MRSSCNFAAVVVMLGWSSGALAQGQGAPCSLAVSSGVSDQRLISGGLERTYRLFVPPAYDGRTRLPLVLDLHGSGGTAAGQAQTSRFEALAAREGFLVASLQAPAATGNRWNVPVTDDRPDDVAYVADVIDDVAATVCTDLDRVFATGFSGGARMSSLLGCKLNSRIAAIAPMAGLRWPAPCEGRAIPVLTIHGLADPQNTYDGHVANRGAEWLESVPDALAGWASHNGCNGDAEFEDPAGPTSTMRYQECRDGAGVTLIRVDGLTHQWPRDEIDGTAAAWAFFREQSL